MGFLDFVGDIGHSIGGAVTGAVDLTAGFYNKTVGRVFDTGAGVLNNAINTAGGVLNKGIGVVGQGVSGITGMMKYLPMALIVGGGIFVLVELKNLA